MAISPGDKLLAVAASAREVPIEGGSGIFAVLDATVQSGEFDSDDKWDYWGWLRSMEEMAFLNRDTEKRKVLIESQFLCRSILRKDEVYLCGARTPEFLDRVKVECRSAQISFSTEHCGQSFPVRVRIRGPEAKLQKFALQVKLQLPRLPTSYGLALRPIHFSDLVSAATLGAYLLDDREFASIEEAIANLSHSFNITDISGQDRELEFFNPVSLRFDGQPPSATQPYVLGRRNYHGLHYKLYLRSEDGSIRVCPDIAKLSAKYFCLSKAGLKLGYNRVHQTALVPKFCPLPLHLARALVLCSCKPPKEVTLSNENVNLLGFSSGANRFSEYRDVPEVIVRIIELHLRMSFKTIEYEEDSLFCKIQ